MSPAFLLHFLSGDNMKKTLHRMKRRWPAVLLALLLSAGAAAAQEFALRSPDGRTEVRVQAAEKCSYSVVHNGAVLMPPTRLGRRVHPPEDRP